MFFFFFKQKTAYDMRISDWSSDVCSSDLPDCARQVIDLWRPWIQSKVGQDLQDLDHLIGNQDAFAKASRQLIADLDLEIGEEGMAEDDASEAEGEDEGGDVDETSEGGTRGTSEDGADTETIPSAMQAGDESADGEDAEEMDLEPGSGDEEERKSRG